MFRSHHIPFLQNLTHTIAWIPHRVSAAARNWDIRVERDLSALSSCPTVRACAAGSRPNLQEALSLPSVRAILRGQSKAESALH